MKILAVVPARGGSKGVPLKNIAVVAGKPLLLWTLDAALSCPELDWLVVSTDHPAIATCAVNHGVEVISRPSELARDNTPAAPVLLHAYEWATSCGRVADVVMTLQPTSPLRTSRHLSEAVALFAKHPEADSLVSVQQVPHQFGPDALMEIQDIWARPVAADIILRRQDKPKYWARNGAAIYLTRPECLGRFVWGGKTLVYPMDKLSSIDVDDEEDLKLADALLRRRALYKEKANNCSSGL